LQLRFFILSIISLFFLSCSVKKTHLDKQNDSFNKESKGFPSPYKKRNIAKRNDKNGTKAFLFSVTSNNGQSSYLFGTMHMGISLKKDMPSIVLKSLQKSKEFIMEADVYKTSQIEAMGLSLMPLGDSLNNYLNNKEMLLLKEKTKGFIPPFLLPKFKPMIIQMILLSKEIPQSEPLDLSLHKNAISEKLNLHFLETGSFQTELLNKIPIKDQIKDLKEMLINPQKAVFNIKKMRELYLLGNLNNLMAFLLKTSSLSKKFENELLDKRNTKWLKLILPLLKKGRVFIAVGVAHLYGENGLINLFKKNGYLIEQL